MKFGRPQDDDPWVTVVGVVADIRQDGLDRPVRPEAYSPHALDPSHGMTFVVRGTGPPDEQVAAARRVVRAFDADLTLTDVTRLDRLTASSVENERFRTSLLAGSPRSHLVRSLLFGVAPYDPATYGTGAAGLGLVAVLACAVPASRAVRVSPIACLREQ